MSELIHHRSHQRSLAADVPRIAAKEFRGFFATPAAYLFLGAFLGVTLFTFFWLESFFARNLADVRPLFQWLPLLLIFLVAALTMRAWSEERRAGTLESLLTAPVSPLALVLGKFSGCLALVAVALALTLPLPITVALLGPLDIGPVIGGYVATLFLAAAYVAIGLTMSSRTDNPIVALILTALVCGLFYVIGSDLLISLFGHQIGGVLAKLGVGTRFESITRGVLDLRDLYYYVAIVGVFPDAEPVRAGEAALGRQPGQQPASRHRAGSRAGGGELRRGQPVAGTGQRGARRHHARRAVFAVRRDPPAARPAARAAGDPRLFLIEDPIRCWHRWCHK